MAKVYFDASVIIAAMLSKTGGSAKLMQFVRLGGTFGITSQTAVSEIEKNSSKIGKSVVQIWQFIQDNGILVRKKISKLEEEPYQKLVHKEDIHIVAGAKLTKCDFLVTLDKKHLLREDIRQNFLPLKIVSPKELLEKLVK